MKAPYKHSYQFIILACVLVGAICGSITFLLDRLLHFISNSIFSFLSPDHKNPILIILPTIGIIITIIFTRYIVHTRLSLGTERIRNYLKQKDYYLPARIMWSPAVATSITLGFGGSAGAEGPSAYAGAAVGSTLGRWFHLSDQQMRLMVGIGAGAGIAGIFRSPIGGVLFTLEVLQMPLTTLPVIGLIVSCLVAGVTSFILSGQQYEVVMLDSVHPFIAEIPWIIILGVICGLYALYYRFIQKHGEATLNAISNPWLKAIMAGLTIGVAVYLFPPLYSTGYGALGKILNGDYSVFSTYGLFAADNSSIFNPDLNNTGILLLFALGIVIIKAFTVVATNYGGGVAGNFAPTLFAGGFVGFIFASALNYWCGTSLFVSNYVYIGMAGAMAGIIKAPLMAMFLTAEMSGHSDFLWPLALVSISAWAISTRFGKNP